jgi:hypothetical protein
MSDTTYNRMIRKLTVAFGNLFDNITLVRYNPDESEQERFLVPLDYATKELYVMRLQGDPNLDKKIQMALPRMSYEMNGISYDASRKQMTNIQNFASTGTYSVSQYMPVPYNFDFSLYLYVRNIEDGNQIIEHILPYFAPDYTIKVNMIPEMGIIKEVPIVLNNTTYEVTYEGDRDSDTRMVVWTLNFTVKGFIFGGISSVGLIQTSITNIYNNQNQANNVLFEMAATGLGGYKIGEIAYQGTSASLATASGRVLTWDKTGKNLVLSNLSGNFVSNQNIIGQNSNASWKFLAYKIIPQELAKVVVTPTYANINEDLLVETDSDPDALIDDLLVDVGTEDLLTETTNTGSFTFNTVITETPNI